MLINSYKLFINNIDKEHLELLNLHSSSPIILDDHIIIISIAVDDFTKSFNKKKENININLNHNQLKYNELLNFIIRKTYYNNDSDIIYNIGSDISIQDIFRIIQYNKKIDSYIYLNNLFIIAVNTNTNNKNIFNLYTNKITKGYCPRFNIYYGFFDDDINSNFYFIIEKLNKCYQIYKNNFNKTDNIFKELVYLEV